MMDWTDRHCRYFHRLLSKHALLYTEMVTTGAILHGDRNRLLSFDLAEKPVALQLGGNEPKALAEAAKIALDYGYDEINLNVGCPSDRVQSGLFGACLMAEPELVMRCVEAIRESVALPVTVKTRIGIDNEDSYEFLLTFIDTVRKSGCDTFIIHARMAWLQGLSPKENREIPPLCYDRVYRLKAERSDLHIDINGGIKNLVDIESHLKHVDGVMIGREAYQNPYFMSEVDKRIFTDESPPLTRHEIIDAMIPYVEKHLAKEGRLQHITRHMLGLFNGQKGARQWRRHLSENAYKDGAGVSVLLDARRRVSDL